MVLHRYALALALALLGGGAFAQSVQATDSAFQRFLISTTGVGQQTIGFTGSGQPVPQTSGHALAADGSPRLRATATGILRNQAGGQIPVSLSGRITPTVVARFIGRAAPVLGVALLASDIADFAREEGFDFRVSDGSVVVVKPDPSICTVAPCYSFVATQFPELGSFSSYAAACAAAGERGKLQYSPPASTATRVGSPGSSPCVFDYFIAQFNQTLRGDWFIASSQVPPAPSADVPSSFSEFEQYLLQGNPYPVTSSVADAILEARQILNEPIPLEQPEVTGPSNSPGSTGTTTKPDGSTVTITQTFNHTYNGPNITTTTTTTTSTVPAGGGPVQTETTVQTPDPLQQEPEPFVMPCGVPGSPPCSVKVDETGMATADDVNADRLKDAEDEFRSWLEGIAAANPFPDIPWDFALPTACGVIPTPAFAPAIEEIDICQFQPMFHELMSVVWMLGGLFGAISLFMRNSLSQ